MKTKSLLLSMTCALGMLCLGGQADAAVLVTNGNFSDLSGLSVQGGGWYNGVPTGWSGINATFTVFDTGSNVVANLGTLAGDGSTPALFLAQSVGTTSFTGNVTLTFDLPGTFGSAYSVGVGIYAGPFTNGTNYAFGLFSNVTGPQTLTTTSPVTAGTDLSIAFYLPSIGNPPALDNVSISQVPEPSTWAMMLLGGVGMLTVLRRRSKQA